MIRLKSFLQILALAVLSVSCSPKLLKTEDGKPIVIYYDNDVHCAADGYAVAASLKAAQKAANPNVLLVSAGDFVQGGSLGAASKGQYIVEIVNRAGYDVMTLGNHEFDYGMPRLGQMSESLDAEIVCCNLYDLRGGKAELMYKPYVMKHFGKVDVAVLGIATPYSFVSSTPSYFQDADGNYVYSLSADDFYKTVQSAVVSARRAGAEYVVAITHLGDDILDEINAIQLISNTYGIDAVLDGHSHSTIARNILRNSKNKPVVHTSTGSHFEAVGKLTIGLDGRISTELIPVTADSPADEAVKVVTDSIKTEYARQGNRVVGRSEAELIAADQNSPRIVRLRETGLGDFCVDAVRMRMNTDIAVLGGGSVRAPIHAGDVTYNDIFTVFPFGNTIATDVMTGQEILDMLEMSVYVSPVEFGGFLQVSGLKFEADLGVGSPVLVDVNKVFVGFDGPQRRVSNVQVMQPDGSWSPLDPAHEYSVSGSAYLLKEHGDGYGSLTGKHVVDTGIQDLQLLEDYIAETLGGVIPAHYAQPEGRITLIR